MFSSLDLLKTKINIEFEVIKLKANVQKSFFNYYSYKLNIVSNSLTFQFFCLGFIIEKVKSCELLLYHFLKERFPEQMESFNYKEYCPDLESKNCLNLIKLYFEAVVGSENNYELFFIYVLIIFGYKKIFHFYEDNIDVKILKKSVEDTVDIVKKKTLFDKAIGFYIFSEFRFNLKNNIEKSQENNLDKRLENNKLHSRKKGRRKRIYQKNKADNDEYNKK